MAEFSGNYITRAAVERRLSVDVVRRIYDDDNIGVAECSEDDPLGQLIKDSEAMFEGYARGIYDLAALRANPPSEAVRLVLDCCDFLAVKRFPRASTRDWVSLEKSVRDELKGLRDGKTRLDVVSTPEPAANNGGRVELYGPENVATDNDPVFTGGFGVF